MVLMTIIQYGWCTSVMLEQLGKEHFSQRFGMRYLLPNMFNTKTRIVFSVSTRQLE